MDNAKKCIPDTKDPLVIRTYFLSNEDWVSISTKLNKKYEMGFKAYVEFLNDRNYENAKIVEIVAQASSNYNHDFIFVADSMTFTTSDNSVLCIDLYDVIGRSFRVIPSELWSVENNLTISNMDFSDFYNSCDDLGVYRGTT
jgi:hypothetical protein